MPKASPRARAALAAAGLALATALTSVDASAAGSLDDAKRWFQEGEDAETAGDCATAVQKFQLALEVKETPQIYLRVGRCQDKLGLLVEAHRSYQKARSLAEGNDKVIEVIDEQIRGLEPRIPHVTLEVKGAPPGLSIKLNGATAKVGDQLVNPGQVAITAEASGYQPFEMKARLMAGDQRTIPIELQRSGADRPAPPPPDHPSSGPHPASFVLIGVGAVGMGVGIGLAVSGFNLQSDLEDPAQFGCAVQASGEYACKRDPFDGKDATSTANKSNTFKTAGWVTFGIGTASAITGVVLAIVTRHPAKDPPPPVSFVPVIGPGQAGFSLSRTF